MEEARERTVNITPQVVELAQDGNANMQFQLANYLYVGDSSKPANPEQGFQWMHAAAENGSIRAHMSVSEFFSDSALCRSMNILPPSIIRMKDLLKEAGFDIDPSIHDIDTLAACVARQVKKHG